MSMPPDETITESPFRQLAADGTSNSVSSSRAVTSMWPAARASGFRAMASAWARAARARWRSVEASSTGDVGGIREAMGDPTHDRHVSPANNELLPRKALWV